MSISHSPWGSNNNANGSPLFGPALTQSGSGKSGHLNSISIAAGGTGFANLAVASFQTGTSNNPGMPRLALVNVDVVVTTNSTGGITSYQGILPANATSVINTIPGATPVIFFSLPTWITNLYANPNTLFSNVYRLGSFVNVSATTVVPPANGVATISVTANGTAYTNNDLVVVSNGSYNAVATIVTNNTGNVVSASLVVAGRGFVNATAVAFNQFTANTSANGATFSVTLGAGSGSNLVPVLHAVPGRLSNVVALFDNTTPGAFAFDDSSWGQFGASRTSVQAGLKNGIDFVTVSAAGAGYNNGDVITMSNGTTNATAIISTNATGNVVAANVTVVGSGFVNTVDTVFTVKTSGGLATGNGVTSATVTAGGSGYQNTNTVITFSNGVVNGTGTVTTNATGGITAVTITNAGSGFAGPSNTVVTITIGTGATLTPVESSAGFTVLVGGEGSKVTAAGWVLREAWEGPLSGLTIVNGGGSYVNLAVASFQSNTSGANAGLVNVDVVVTTNATGGITSYQGVAVPPPNTTNLKAGSNNLLYTVPIAFTQLYAVSPFSNVYGQGLFVNVSSITVVANASNGIATVSVTAAGTGYVNNDLVLISNGTYNAVAAIVTNNTGNVVSTSLLLAGRGFVNATAVAFNQIVAANGSGATFSVTIGGGANASITPTLAGRAGRVFYETIVFSNEISNPNTAVQLPGAVS